MGGELFQNNHHRFPKSMNFAKQWFEIDPVYPILKLLSAIKIIHPKDKKDIINTDKVEMNSASIVLEQEISQAEVA